jgi:hypothetical protein
MQKDMLLVYLRFESVLVLSDEVVRSASMDCIYLAIVHLFTGLQ